jgi:hypothetical protein
MFSRVQQNQHHSAAQRPIGRNYRRVRKALPVREPVTYQQPLTAVSSYRLLAESHCVPQEFSSF